jgi:hypothetical protein
MKTVKTLLGITFTISAKLKETGVKFPNSDKKDNTLHNHYRVTIKTNSGSTTFDFYSSNKAFINGWAAMDNSTLEHALYCFVSDACSAKDSFEDFCGELGYDTDSRRAEKIYKACEQSLAAYDRICSVDIYDMVNSLND